MGELARDHYGYTCKWLVKQEGASTGTHLGGGQSGLERGLAVRMVIV